jgi:peptidoglycan/LPS O-acetylase OafA/YrhL
MKYRPPLDGLRALCAAAVFVFHAAYGHIAGMLGVDVFFVLSGYLITRILLDDIDAFGHVRYGRFYLRRARRLLPAVFVALVLVFLLWPSGERDQYPQILPPVLLYYVNWLMAFGRQVKMLTHFWTLSTEEQFYLFWPLILAALARLGRQRMVSVTCLLIVVFATARAVLSPLGWPVGNLFGNFSTFARVDELLIGAAATMIHGSPEASRARGIERVARRLAVPAAVALLLCVFFSGHDYKWLLEGGFTAVALAAAALIVHGASGEDTRLNRFLSARPLVWAGKRSYGIYVFHMPIISAFQRWRVHGVGNFLLVTVGSVVATLAVAWASYALVESRFLSPSRAAPEGAAAAVAEG